MSASTPAATTRPVRFGLLGAGGIATTALAPALHAADGAVLQAVAARDPARGDALGPAGRSYPDYAALLADDEVDVVYVSLCNDAHQPWTVAALDAGKHVLCEKPLGLDAGEVRRMVRASADTGRLLVEAFWYRWHPRTRRLEQLLAEGAPGRVRAVETDFTFESDLTGNFRLDPARGGGALYDVGCYAVSAAHLVLGRDLAVEEATADLGPTGVDLSAAATLVAATGPHPGARATARCGMAGPARQVIRVEGEAATLEFDQDAFASWNRPSTLTVTTPDGRAHVERFEPVDPYRLMVEAVAARVRGEDAFVVDLDHSLDVAGTLDAARSRLLG